MVGYTACENAVKTRILAHFSAELTKDEYCQCGDSDTLFTALFRDSASYGCLIDIGNPAGRDITDAPFKGQIISWQIIGVFILRYGGENITIEVSARAIIDKIASLFSNDHTAGGVASRFRVVLIDPPERVDVNDLPFYFIGFNIEVWDK